MRGVGRASEISLLGWGSGGADPCNESSEVDGGRYLAGSPQNRPFPSTSLRYIENCWFFMDVG